MAVVGADPATALSPASGGADALAAVKQLVLDAVSSPLTRVMYARALEDFFGWWNGTGPAAVHPRYGAGLAGGPRSQGARAGQRESEALGGAEAGRGSGVQRAARSGGGAGHPGHPRRGAARRPHGNWLTKRQAETLLAAPDPATNQGKRDRAILAVLVGCGLRRDEAARLTIEHIQQRDGRWCVVDLVGKKGHVRTVPMPPWTKAAIESWGAAAGITAGPVFRGVNKGDVVTGDRLSTQGILRAVGRYAEAIAPHDLRRTFAKLAFKGGAKLDQIQLSLGHASIQTTERYLGVQQDLTDAPCDYLHLRGGVKMPIRADNRRRGSSLTGTGLRRQHNCKNQLALAKHTESV